MNDSSELEVQFKADTGKAVIEGKTVVPFQAFVTLVLQRKVLKLFKDWGKEPVIVNSELLTHLASAPQDSQENRGNLIMVTLGMGLVAGIALFALIQLGLLLIDIRLNVRELGLIGGGIVVLAALVGILMKARRMPRGEKLTETIENVASFLGK